MNAGLTGARYNGGVAASNSTLNQPARAAVQLAFDHVAADYDLRFTNSALGRLQREAVWRQIGELFRSGDSVLDLGCGTGADAVRLARRGVRVEAIDISQGMIAVTRARVESEGLQQLVNTRVLAIEDLARMTDSVCYKDGAQRFDGVLSNFGALNCVRDWGLFASALRGLMRKGAFAALGVLGRFCLWETLYYGLRSEFGKASRRWNGEARASLGSGEDFAVYYPTVGQIKRSFQPGFRLRKVAGVGVFVPPTFATPMAMRFPGLVEGLGVADRRLESWGGFRAAADHRLLVFEAV